MGIVKSAEEETRLIPELHTEFLLKAVKAKVLLGSVQIYDR